jgi:hypothetical protein
VEQADSIREITAVEKIRIIINAFLRTAREPVGLRKSKRKFGWARIDFVDFAGQ